MRVISQDGTMDVPYEISSFLWHVGNIKMFGVRLFIVITAIRRQELKWLNTVQKKGQRKPWKN